MTPRLPSFRSHLGFTLLELLVVLVLVGIVLSFAVLSVGRDGEVLEREAGRLQALVNLASEQALLESRELGVLFARDGYTFLVLEEKRWRTLVDDGPLRPRRLPDGIEIELFVESLPVTLGGDDEEVDKAEAPMPQLLLLSSGERTPFSLTVSMDGEGDYFLLEGGLYGATTLTREGA